jgi:hypothetical protein
MTKADEYRALRKTNVFAAAHFYRTNQSDLSREFDAEDGITPTAPAVLEPSAEQVAADATALARYRQTYTVNPIKASRLFSANRESICRAMMREENEPTNEPPTAA